jgi:maleylacetoacetate isomerase
MLTLYDFFRSSAAWRVRIALALKQVPHQSVHIHLMKEGGQHRGPAYQALNPQERVPVLEIGGNVIGQSFAILEYLEETYPNPPLLPKEPVARAHVRALALAIVADIHPLQNLRVRDYVEKDLGQGKDGVIAWCKHWIEDGLRGLEGMARKTKGPFLYGAQPTLADCCLVPQMFNLRLFGQGDEKGLDRLLEAEAAALALPAFRDTAPGVHPNRD